MGAEPILGFVLKHPPCLYWRDHAKEIEFGELLTVGKSFTSELLKNATIRKDGESDFRFSHPALRNDFVHVSLTANELRGKKAGAIRRRLVTQTVIDRFLAYLIEDLRAARKLRRPLGATSKFQGDMIAKATGAAAADVAFAVDLPFLEGVSISDLLKFRTDEYEYFRRFQIALRTCINERIRSIHQPNAAAVATQISRGQVPS